MLSNTALGVPRFSMTRDRCSSSTLRNSLPKPVRALSAETTMGFSALPGSIFTPQFNYLNCTVDPQPHQAPCPQGIASSRPGEAATDRQTRFTRRTTTRSILRLLPKWRSNLDRCTEADRHRPPATRRRRQARSASLVCCTPGTRNCCRTLTHDAGHYHLLLFQRTDDAGCLHCPRVVSACLSAGTARRCFEPVRHPNPCGEFPRGRGELFVRASASLPHQPFDRVVAHPADPSSLAQTDSISIGLGSLLT